MTTTAEKVSAIAGKQSEPFDGLEATDARRDQVFACLPEELTEIIKNKQQELGFHTFPTAAVMATILFNQQGTEPTIEGISVQPRTEVNDSDTVGDQTRKTRECLMTVSTNLNKLLEATDDATRAEARGELVTMLPEAHITPHDELQNTGQLSSALESWIKRTLDATGHIIELLRETSVLAETMRNIKKAVSPVESIHDGFSRALDPIKDVTELRAMILRMQPSKTGGF
jgi:hypothetical protein